MPAISLVAAFSPAAGASTAARAVTPRAQALAIAKAALRHLDIGQHAADHQVPGALVSGHARIDGLTQVESTNWSGYADTGSGYASVTGKWSEPSGSCTSATSLAAFWVGIDGYSSNSVEQDGTLIECYFDTAYYFSWWEMYPSNAIQVVGESVVPGDAITASVTRSGGTYTLKVTDSTHTANSFTTTQSCSSCANSSAEWIAEAPSGSAGVYPLTDYHSWGLNSATVKEGSTSGVISSFTDDEITMVDGSGNVESQPGALSSGGNGFTCTWKRST